MFTATPTKNNRQNKRKRVAMWVISILLLLFSLIKWWIRSHGVCVYTVKAMERESNLHTHLFAYCGKQEEKTSNNNNNNRNRRDRLSGGIPPFLSFHSHFFLSFFSCFFFIFFCSFTWIYKIEKVAGRHTHTSPHGACSTSVISVSLSFFFLLYNRR